MSIQQHRGKSQLIDGECRIVKKTVEDMANWIKENTDPRIYPQMKIHSVDGKDVIEIVVKEADEKPVFFSSHAYQRVGRTNQRISVSKIRELATEIMRYHRMFRSGSSMIGSRSGVVVLFQHH